MLSISNHDEVSLGASWDQRVQYRTYREGLNLEYFLVEKAIRYFREGPLQEKFLGMHCWKVIY